MGEQFKSGEPDFKAPEIEEPQQDVDPRAEALARFQELEAATFLTLEDQKKAKEDYQKAVKRALLHGPHAHAEVDSVGEISIEPGTIVYHAPGAHFMDGQYQEIRQPFPTRVNSVDYGYARSELLPDASHIEFPSTQIEEWETDKFGVKKERIK